MASRNTTTRSAEFPRATLQRMKALRRTSVALTRQIDRDLGTSSTRRTSQARRRPEQRTGL